MVRGVAVNPTLPDFTMSADEVLQCVKCGELKPANEMCRDLDKEGDFYCIRCAWWSALPQQESETESRSEKPRAMENKQFKASTAIPDNNPKKFIIVTVPTYKKAASKTPAKSYPKLQDRFASYNPDVIQTPEDVDRLFKGVEKVKARIKKEKESQN
jgi:hypothetical protein